MFRVVSTVVGSYVHVSPLLKKRLPCLQAVFRFIGISEQSGRLQPSVIYGKIQPRRIKRHGVGISDRFVWRVAARSRWASARLKGYMIKGFTMDDERLKGSGGAATGKSSWTAVVQNKLHYVAHGHTAAEVIYQWADAQKPFMGLKAFAGEFPAARTLVWQRIIWMRMS